MRRFRLITILAAAAVAAASTAALARGDSFVVQHDRYTSSGVFTDTSFCGFPIKITNSANIDDTYFLDSTGTPVRLLETVNHATLTFSANGHTLEGIGSGGFDVSLNADGSVTVNTFGINIRVTLPGSGTVILDAGRATYLFDPHIHLLFQAGPQNYDLTTFCNALAPPT